MIPSEVKEAGPEAVKIYRTAIKNGSTERGATMYALKAGPRLMTDAVYLEGQGTLEKQFRGDPGGLKMVLDGAKKKGFVPSMNSVYEPGLASCTGDPVAFVQGRGDIKRACEINNQASIGAVNHEAVEVEPKKRPNLAYDLALGKVRGMVGRNPEILQKSTIPELVDHVQSTAQKPKLMED